MEDKDFIPECPECGHKRFIYKTTVNDVDIQHDVVKCEECGNIFTIDYTRGKVGD